jgi:hypothetical protein
MPPAAAAGAARGVADDNDAIPHSSTDDGVPVGAADAEEDARRSGAGDDDRGPGDVLGSGAGVPTDDGVPVGAADAEADREAATRQPD